MMAARNKSGPAAPFGASLSPGDPRYSLAASGSLSRIGYHNDKVRTTRLAATAVPDFAARYPVSTAFACDLLLWHIPVARRTYYSGEAFQRRATFGRSTTSADRPCRRDHTGRRWVARDLHHDVICPGDCNVQSYTGRHRSVC